MKRRSFLQLLGAAIIAKPALAAVTQAPKVQEIHEGLFLMSGELPMARVKSFDATEITTAAEAWWKSGGNWSHPSVVSFLERHPR